ncbi:MAG: phage tail assembly chaperone [Pseudomonadota bacterium]
MTIREAAPHWFWLAAQSLGWRPDEFWRATPSELTGALRDPSATSGHAAPDLELIRRMIERDTHGR